MRNQSKHILAMTLTELLVVISVMAIMLAAAVPVAKKLAESLGESTGAKSIIAAAMSNARAIAVRDQKYAGVRFQQDSTGRQYLVLIIHDPNATILAGLENRFRAIPGKKPMALPQDVKALSCRVQKLYTNNLNDSDRLDIWDLEAVGNPNLVAADPYLDSDIEMNDAATFSIIFNPSGKFVVHPVRVYNAGVNDTVFNTKVNYDLNTAKFRQDELETFEHDGFQEENSIPSFKIYSKKDLDKVVANQRWSAYLGKLIDKEFINPYTGEMIKK